MQQTPTGGGEDRRRDSAPDGDERPGDSLALANARLTHELDAVRARERALLLELASAVRDLHEKDVLLREAGHRLKNTLQLACSMLQSQARSAAGKDAKDELEAAGARLKAVADLQIGLRDPGERVQLDQWLPAACRSMALKPGIELDVRAPPMVVPGWAASPMGLFVCEAVCNAMKHAFAEGETGRVLVQVVRQGEDWRLSIADDGRGDPDRMEPGYGMRLLGLLARQLRGRLEIGGGLCGRGLSVSAVFPAPEAARPSPTHA
jgi:two-component sensor histidine kinase